jgi:hypothetical protein
MTFNRFAMAVLSTLLAAVFGLAFAVPSTRADSTVSITSDTAVFLRGSGITLTLAGGSTLVSYSADAATLTLSLDAASTVTVKSNTLYTLTNSQNNPTECSASPAYSYVTFTATGPASVSVTPSATVACSGTAPVISTFSAAPAAITAGQTSTLAWSIDRADSVSLDHGLGAQSTASSSAVTVSPTETAVYTLTATNYIGTTTAQTTVTVTPAASGGGGGAVITRPTISAFTAWPPLIQSGQTSTLSWSVTGAASLSFTPALAAASFSPPSGTATVTPATTTTYTLTALISYGQSATASTTVMVLANTPMPPPSHSATTTPAYCLVNQTGTFYLILNGIRHGIANPGLLFSYGYNFSDAITDTAAYQALQSGDLLGPNNGALVKAPNDPTVYLISGQAKHGFTSAKVFTALGYKFSSVLTIPSPQLHGLPQGLAISNAQSRHLPGARVTSRGTVYYLDEATRRAYPSLAVYNSWNFRSDFSRVVPANAADLSLPVGPVVTPRSSCSSQ